MNYNFNNKIKSAALAAVLALAVNFGIPNDAYAINYSNIDLNNKFAVEISYGRKPTGSYTAITRGYLVYSPTDIPIYASYSDYSGQASNQVGTLEGGKLYYIYQSTTAAGNFEGFKFVADGVLIQDSNTDLGQWSNITTLGNAADIFGEGIPKMLKYK